MRILMLSPGTRGDVAPATGLGAAFTADGHDVTIVANTEYTHLIEAAGCTVAPVDASLSPPPEASGVRAHLAALRSYMDAAAAVALDAAQGTEVILANAISPYGHDIAEAVKVPSADMLLQPWYPSAAYPPMIAGAKDLGGFGNRWAGRLAARVRAPYDPPAARIRAGFGLPPRSRAAGQRLRHDRGVPVHHGISPVVLPRPADWPDHLRLDGFWWPHEPPGAGIPDEVTAFLADGPAPVVVTLGSMSPESDVVQAVAAALKMTGARAVVQGNLDIDSGNVLHVGDVPHSLLLPQASVVVHHAGAGVTSAALRAGVPSVPMPMHTDQHFWARRLVALDAATSPIPMRRADGAALAAAISEAVDGSRLRAGAATVGAALAREDGTASMRDWLRTL